MRRPFRIFTSYTITIPATAFLLFLLLNQLFPLRPMPGYSPLITDRRGNLMHAFLSPDDKWRMKLHKDSIPEMVRKAIVFKEDRYFSYHPGVNPAAVVRAAFNNLVQGKTTSGASTITMQVARLLYPAPRTIPNKIREMFRSFQLEWAYTKDEILTLYLNLVPYGGNIEGIAAASQIYFGTDPRHVNLSQAVILCVIPNRPGSLRPSGGVSRITEARNKWLKRMERNGVFAAEDVAQAMAETVVMTRNEVPRRIPHLAYRFKKTASHTGTFRSTIDAGIQDITETVALKHARRISPMQIRNIAVVVVENDNRKVRAYMGSQDFSDERYSGQVDGCMAVRSPGSALKPLVYALAIDKGLITPAAMLVDVPVNYSGYTPENFNSKCHGLISASQALSHSLNIPAVSLLSETGLSQFTGSLRKCGFRSLHSDRELGLPVVLGGCGVRATELASLFCTFANGGIYMPLCYQENMTEARPVRIVSEASAYMITEMLAGTERPDFPDQSGNISGTMKLAWKTGTSYGRKDAWCIGYNGKYTIAVWAGNFNGTGVPELTGSSIATPLLFDLFRAIDRGSPKSWFVPPASADIRLVCPHSGLPPGADCADLVPDYFIASVSDNRPCTHVRTVFTAANGSFAYCMQCLPESGYKKELVENLPPAVTSFYESQGIAYHKPPPHNPGCARLYSEKPPQIISPVDGREYLLEKNAGQQLALHCQVTPETGKVYWFVNDHLLDAVAPGTPVFFAPDPGEYKISCSDDQGRNQDIHIRVTGY
jgi:penicillin-binding protein 1C